MRCPSCDHDNRADRRFCVECGTTLAAGCASCGAASQPGEKFCGGCRAHLARLRGDAPAAQRETAEARRLYTEMGATAQTERLAQDTSP